MAVSLVWLAIALHCLPATARCQAAKESVVEARGYRVRILWPPEAAVDPEVIDRLIGVLRGQIPVPGVPADQFKGTTIKITLATGLRSGVDAWALPGDHLISLSLDGVIRWKLPKLRQVVRHEIAHLELSAFLGDSDVPGWFQEGIAEWWAGGLTCEGEIRIRLDLIHRREDGEGVPALFGPGEFAHSRLAYDYLASYFDYVDVRGAGVISDGRLLPAAKEQGVNDALTAILGMNLAEIIEAWWAYILEQYGGFPDSPIC